jgi:hypothetical protein
MLAIQRKSAQPMDRPRGFEFFFVTVGRSTSNIEPNVWSFYRNHTGDFTDAGDTVIRLFAEYRYC